MYADYHGMYRGRELLEDPKEEFVVVESSGSSSTELSTKGMLWIIVLFAK